MKLDFFPHRHRPAPGRGVWRKTAAALAVAACLTVTGCGLRLETSLPAEPTPDASETLRQAMVADVLTIQALAKEVTDSGTLAANLAPKVAQVTTFAAAHLTALGGVYTSGLSMADDPTTNDPLSPSAGATSTTPDIAALVKVLASSATRARGSLGTSPDPVQVRLYASVAASEMAQAQTLATAAGIEPPTDNFTTALRNPAQLALPTGVESDSVSDLVAGEDAIGYSREILALQRLTGTKRTEMLNKAVANRDRATTWAVTAGLDGTADDPRQVVYPLNAKLTSTKSLRTHLVTLCDDQTHRISALFTSVTADQRAATVDLLTDSYLDGLAAGTADVALPGLTEYTAEGTK